MAARPMKGRGTIFSWTILKYSDTQYPNCIRTTAVDALARDYQTIVATDACSAQTERIAANNIEDMRNMGLACLTFQELSNLSGEKP